MEYTIKWKNQGGVKESGMTKWILQLKNNTGGIVKTTEDDSPSNLQNFSDVEIKMALSYAEAVNQTSTNKILIYFDSVSDSTKLGEMTVLFDVNKLPVGIEDIKTEFTLPIGTVFRCSSNNPLNLDTFNYEYIGNDIIKYKPYSSHVTTYDCGDFTYTGVKHRDTSARCGWDIGRCPGTQCCSSSGWCGGEIGTESAWCKVKKTIDDKYFTYVGYTDFLDGNSVKDMKINNKTVENKERCGPEYGNCNENECCNHLGYCGGSKPTYDQTYCNRFDKFSIRSGFSYKGLMYDNDGDGSLPQSQSVPMTSQNIVFRCRNWDPLRKNNNSIYKWENGSLKDISSVPGGYIVYTLPSCDGIEYGGPG